MSIRCSLGWHDYNWTYNTSGSCEQRGRCRRCDTRSPHSRTVHAYSSWIYLPGEDCNQTRSCQRNATHPQESRGPIHVWGPSAYQREGNCERLAICERSSEHIQRTVEHIWGAPIRGVQCRMTQRCTRCPHGEEYLGVSHDFLPTEDSRDGKIRRCRYCPYVKQVE
jgi:hypothetical protein